MPYCDNNPDVFHPTIRLFAGDTIACLAIKYTIMAVAQWRQMRQMLQF